MNTLNSLDVASSELVYNSVNSNEVTGSIPFYFGLLPYELYVLPGMYLAILQVIWLETLSPVQFHLLPHFFAFSIFQGLKKTIRRGRPGCVNTETMGGFIDASHCEGKFKWQSFPSGHTGVAFSLATALAMEMLVPETGNFFDIEITSNTSKWAIAIVPKEIVDIYPQSLHEKYLQPRAAAIALSVRSTISCLS